MAKFKQYKIARRLGVRVFPKTENPKFAVGKKVIRARKHMRPMSEYGLQMLEKQKARYYYGLRERQFSNYVARATERKDVNPVEFLYRMLESRLDNCVYRLGIAKTRALGRQMISHGHITVNGKKVTIPSYMVTKSDVVSVRKESKNKKLFEGAAERLKDHTAPSWLTLDLKNLEGTVVTVPSVEDYSGALFNLTSVIEFYSR